MPWQVADLSAPEDDGSSKTLRPHPQARATLSRRSLDEELSEALSGDERVGDSTKNTPNSINQESVSRQSQAESSQRSPTSMNRSQPGVAPAMSPRVLAPRHSASSTPPHRLGFSSPGRQPTVGLAAGVSQRRLKQVQRLSETVEKLERTRSSHALTEKPEAKPAPDESKPAGGDTKPPSLSLLRKAPTPDNGLASALRPPPSTTTTTSGPQARIVERVEHVRPLFPNADKVRIVKPMEGSVTLLKWHLLAMQTENGRQLTSKDSGLPGVHVKSHSPPANNRRASQAQAKHGKVHRSSVGHSPLAEGKSSPSSSPRVVSRASMGQLGKPAGVGLGALLGGP